MDFYRTAEGIELMDKTNEGMFAFVWEAEDVEGAIVRQFDEVAFQMALRDDEFVLPVDPLLRLSVDALDRERIRKFKLLATALAKKLNPVLSPEIFVEPNLESGERFKSYWLVDHNVNTGRKIFRTVIGIERSAGEPRLDLTVISPSGICQVCHDDNCSFEGE